jgi:hypothetical protein
LLIRLIIAATATFVAYFALRRYELQWQLTLVFSLLLLVGAVYMRFTIRALIRSQRLQQVNAPPLSARTMRLRIMLLVVGVVIALLVVPPLHRNGHYVAFSTYRLTAQLYTSQRDKAQSAVEQLETHLTSLEEVFGITPGQRPLIRIYDPGEFPGGDEDAHYHDNTICVKLAYPDSPQGQRIQYDEVLIHEYVHFLVQQRAAVAGGREVPLWLNEGLAEWNSNPWLMTGLRHDDLQALGSLKDAGAELKYGESLMAVRYLATEYSEDKLMTLVDAYARGDADPLASVLGISEDAILAALRTQVR